MRTPGARSKDPPLPLTSSLTPRARLAVRVAGIALALALAALSAHTLLHIGTHGVAQVLFDNWLYNCRRFN